MVTLLSEGLDTAFLMEGRNRLLGLSFELEVAIGLMLRDDKKFSIP